MFLHCRLEAAFVSVVTGRFWLPCTGSSPLVSSSQLTAFSVFLLLVWYSSQIAAGRLDACG